MIKKRVIFTLLYSDGMFMLSRNFRLQKVGNINWLSTNYNFSRTSNSIDELIVLDVSRVRRNQDLFCSVIKELASGCFVPIAVGGGVNSIEFARELLRSGADKLVINSILFEDNNFIRSLSSEFGQQCLVASIDLKKGPEGEYRVWTQCGSKCLDGNAPEWINYVVESDIGEVYLNSIDRDGTGQGLDMDMLNLLPTNISKSVILAGGVGNAAHLALGLSDIRVDAVATANLFNFVGDGLRLARNSLLEGGINLPCWYTEVTAKN